MKISVVVPAYGEQSHLSSALETWYPQRHEITELIVVDDGSPKPLHAPGWVNLIRIARDPIPRGSSAAKNYGASLATGNYLLFADADILQLPDATLSLKHQMAEWENEGEPDTLLNVTRYGLPQDFPARRTRNVEALCKRLLAGKFLFDPDLKESNACWEQNCGLIRRDLFDRIGGYDAETFKSWGFNNHDLCMRVFLAHGRVSSAIPRVLTGKRLYCFHLWHDAPRDRSVADEEFKSKWGEPWTHMIMEYTQHRAAREAYERSAVQG